MRSAFAVLPLLPRAGVLLLCTLWLTSCASVPFDYPRESSQTMPLSADTTLGEFAFKWKQEHGTKAGFIGLPLGADALGLRLRMLEHAEHSIDAQYFILKKDQAGTLFASALLAAADAANLTIGGGVATPPPGARIALARDAAFSFVYPHLIQGWRAAGATILPFSPLADEAPDPSADCCWLPGGYPELHAGKLAANSQFLAGTRAFAATKPVHGECGGYMAMGAAIIDKAGGRHEMAGLLGLVTSFEKRRMHLGYRLAELDAPLPGYAAGARLRGHEFHYSELTTNTPDVQNAYRISDRSGLDKPPDGYLTKRTLGSYNHLHFGSQPAAAKYFVENCLAYQRQKEKRI